jgi:hypothetical protein
MSVQSRIVDPTSGREAKVTAQGQLVTAPLDYSDSVYNLLDVGATAYNFFGPRDGSFFVVTGIVYRANRNVSTVTDAELVIYEASSATSTTELDVIHEDALIRGESLALLGLNRKVAEGRWVNAKTSDDDIACTIFGYYAET